MTSKTSSSPLDEPTNRRLNYTKTDYEIVTAVWRWMKEWALKDGDDWYSQMSNAMMELYGRYNAAAYEFAHDVITACAKEVIRIHGLAIDDTCYDAGN